MRGLFVRPRMQQLESTWASVAAATPSEAAWSWANDSSIQAPVLEALKGVQAFTEGGKNSFWQNWRLNDDFKKWAMKSFEEEELFTQLSRLEDLHELLDKLDQQIRIVKRMHAARQC
eukprot:14637120-Alexandrium_andersonii.AAC.1